MAEAAPVSARSDVYDAERWGLPLEAVQGLGEQLQDLWERYRDCFRTRTRNTNENALVYLRGLMLLDGDRNIANIARRVLGIDDDGQNLQQFLSDSPWDGQRVFGQIQQ